MVKRSSVISSLLIIMIFASPLVLLGQNKAVPISLSFFNESTAIPFTRFLTTPIHPGIQAGTELNYKMKEHSRLFQTANICYFYHNYLAQGIGISTELGFEYRLRCGLAFSGLLGAGYMHTLATTEEFTFSGGQYEKKPDKGNARLYPTLSLDMGYYFKNPAENNPRLFIRYQSWAEYPYSPGFIPVMTHISLHIGATFFIITKAREHD